MNANSNRRAERTKELSPINFQELVGTEISKPGRYLGNELGVKPKDWDSAGVRWALTYPELYEVGASNLGHIILYTIINTLPDQICDRCYLPGTDLATKLRKESQPLFAVETHRPLYAFDILGFSLAYELGATNILEMLDLANISIYSNKREDLKINNPESCPLIFAGGPTATSNPEPYAAFFDFIALGDGEELLPEIGLVVSEAKANGLTRSETLNDLSEIPGIYIPSLYKSNKKDFFLKPINKSVPEKIIRRVSSPIPYYGLGLVPNIETIHDRLTIEIRRGCTRGCRFCQPGMLTRPARDVKPDQIIKTVENGIKQTGYNDFTLLSLSCSDYLALPAVGVELRNKLASKNITLQLPSQRIDRFNDDIAHIVGGTRQASLTFAPEAGTQKLRNIINKGLTDIDLLKGISSAMRNGHRKVKLYFMIGLPGEEDIDVIGIAKTCKFLQDSCNSIGRLSINLTISNFTPKPHTPFQWHSISNSELLRRQNLLKTSFKELKLKNIKVNFTDIRISAMENFIGRGDRRISKVIEKAWEAGAGMDAWFESLDRAFSAWEKAIFTSGLANNYRDIEIGSWNKIKELRKIDLVKLCTMPLPWDHIDTGIDKRWLAKDLIHALNEEIVPDCSFNECSGCGVCGEELGHNVIVPPIRIPEKLEKISELGNKVCRIRLRFEKTGKMAFLSHLDIVRVIERALRRSNLPISYSEGFHPLPRIKIALALSLGVEGLGELMDIDFIEKVNPREVVLKLNKVLPEGLNLITGESISILKKYSLSQQIKSAVWSFNLSIISETEQQLQHWNKALTDLLNADELIWSDHDKKGRIRERDLKALLYSLEIEYEPSKRIKNFPEKTVRLKLESLINKSGISIKPIQIHHWIQEYLKQPLKMTDIKRDELQLFQC